jgi:hypothetical protein
MMRSDFHVDRDAPSNALGHDTKVLEQPFAPIEPIGIVSPQFRGQLDVDAADSKATVGVARDTSDDIRREIFGLEPHLSQTENQARRQAIANGCSQDGGGIRPTPLSERRRFVEHNRRQSLAIFEGRHEFVPAYEAQLDMVFA